MCKKHNLQLAAVFFFVSLIVSAIIVLLQYCWLSVLYASSCNWLIYGQITHCVGDYAVFGETGDKEVHKGSLFFINQMVAQAMDL